jgi:hypothetical protein
MVTYSQWRPDGGYDYYESEAEVAILGNDLPTPQLEAASAIGVPSIEAGRRVPAGARHVGSGERAVGIVAPADMSRLGLAVGAGEAQDDPRIWFVAGALTVAAAWLIVAAVRRRR